MTTQALTITVDPDTISLRQMRALSTAKGIDETVTAICAITGLSAEQALDIGPKDMRALKRAIQQAWQAAADDPN